MRVHEPGSGSGRIASRVTVGLLLAGLLATAPVLAARPAGEAGGRPREGPAGWEAERRDPVERRATRERRRELRREYLDSLSPERRRELRRWMRERRSDRHWLREAPAATGDRSDREEGRRLRHRRQPPDGSGLDAPRRIGESSAGELREQLRQLRPEQRRALRRRLQSLRELPEPERSRMGERYRTLRERPPEERDRLRKKSRRWQAMPSERRDELREKMQQLRALPPEERLRLLDELLVERDAELPDDGI